MAISTTMFPHRPFMQDRCDENSLPSYEEAEVCMGRFAMATGSCSRPACGYPMGEAARASYM